MGTMYIAQLHELIRQLERGIVTESEMQGRAFQLVFDSFSPDFDDSRKLAVARSWTETLAACCRRDRAGDRIALTVLTMIQGEEIPGQWLSMIEDRIRPYIAVGDNEVVADALRAGGKWWPNDLLGEVTSCFPAGNSETGEIASLAACEQLKRGARDGSLATVNTLLHAAPAGTPRSTLLTEAVVASAEWPAAKSSWWDMLRSYLTDPGWRLCPDQLLIVVSYCVADGLTDLARHLLVQVPDPVPHQTGEQGDSVGVFDYGSGFDYGFAAVLLDILGDTVTALRWSEQMMKNAVEQDRQHGFPDHDHGTRFSEYAGWILARELVEPRDKIRMLKRSEDPDRSWGLVESRRHLIAAEAYLDLDEPQPAAFFLRIAEEQQDSRRYHGYHGQHPGWSDRAVDALYVSDREFATAHHRLADLGYVVCTDTDQSMSHYAEESWARSAFDDEFLLYVAEHPYARPIGKT